MAYNNQKLSVEELQIENDLDNYAPVVNLEQEKKRYASIAKTTITHKKQRKAITIRLPESVIENFKQMAQEEGIPYQTLISSVLYKVANKKIKLMVE